MLKSPESNTGTTRDLFNMFRYTPLQIHVTVCLCTETKETRKKRIYTYIIICVLASVFHPKFKLSWYRGDDLNSKQIVDEMTKLVYEKIVIEKDLTNSSSGSEDNPETFFNNL